MSLKFLLDEDIQSSVLSKLLRQAGHIVLTVNELGLAGQSDPIVFDRAKQEDCIIITHNCRDFENLHQIDSQHLGILGIYRNSTRMKDMTYPEMVKAIANLEAAEIDLSQQFISLNAWNY